MHHESLPGLATGIRQRATATNSSLKKRSDFEIDAEEQSSMGSLRSVILVVAVLGIVSFSGLAMLFSTRYAFIGFRGNMEEAATSCWQTAIMFAIVALFTAFPSMTSVFTARTRAYAMQKKYTLPTVNRR